ncbi:hypothetical protein BD769DRAFT_964967 [Suillus cothurnatus]|nr:hypothetical protein BD769DRAFT_964967 [Suillus cothurnatus]
MVNWKDPDLEAKLEVLSVQLLYAVLGLYGWEYIRSSHVEVALIQRQLQFRWPLLSYISARFGFLIAVILSAMQSSPFRTNVDCITFAIVFLTNLAIGCSTTNLMIRTQAPIYFYYLLRILLVLLSLGHWTLLTLSTARASTMNGVCVMNFVNPTYASAVVIYVMLYDLALLVFTVIGLLRMPSSSTLWKKLVKQGVVYFILNFAANLILLALNRLNYNPMMNTIFAMPAACICTIASNQVVLSLIRPSSDHESDSTSSAKMPPLTSDFSVSMSG